MHETIAVFDGEITSALVGIALELSVVSIPMAFFGGSTGVIYRQFSIGRNDLARGAWVWSRR